MAIGLYNTLIYQITTFIDQLVAALSEALDVAGRCHCHRNEQVGWAASFRFIDPNIYGLLATRTVSSHESNKSKVKV